MKMKLNYFFILWVLLLGSCYAQVTAVTGTASGGNCSGTSAQTNCTAPGTQVAAVAVGDTIVAMLTSNNGATSPVLSGCGLTWPTPTRDQSAAGPSLMVVWIIDHVTTADPACNVTINGLQGGNFFGWHRYQNVTSIGTLQIHSTQVANATTATTQPRTATNAGNFIVGLFFLGTLGTVTPVTGVGDSVFRRGNALSGTAVGGFMADIRATSAGQSLTVGLTPAIVVSYKSATVELVGALPNRPAELTDAMQTLVMNAPRNMNYVLNPSVLSPTWCTWFMPSASNTYQLEPTTTHVNGQANPVTIPPWQMTRICQDHDGNFWASPPLLAGTGISIAPSATGLTISSTGIPGVSGMTYINGGTTTIPGTVTINANTCNTLETTTASTTPSAVGIQASDVVSWSFRSGETGWGNGAVSLRPEAYAGSIAWRACNSGSSNYTPGARMINWYVARASAGAFRARHHRVEHHEVEHKKPARPTK